MLLLCESMLHDGIVESVRGLSTDTVTLEIDSRNCPSGTRGRCLLTFHGVKLTENFEDLEDSSWIYEEVHLHPEGRFDLRALLHSPKTADHLLEIRVVADDLILDITDEAPRPVVGISIPYMGEDGMYVWTEMNGPGTPSGWCLMSGDRVEPKTPPPEAFERMRALARGIGAVVAGDPGWDHPPGWRRVLPP